MKRNRSLHQVIEYEPDYPIEMMRIKEGQYEEMIYCHHHPYTEIIYVMQGRLKLEIDQEVMVLEQGDFAFVSPEQIHHGNSDGQEGCELMVAVLDWQVIGYPEGHEFSERYIKPLQQGDYHLPSRIIYQKSPEIASLFAQRMHAIYEKYLRAERIDRDMLRVMVAEWLLLLYQDGFIRMERNMNLQHDHLQIIKRALDYMEEHHAEKISIPQMASFMLVSEDYFYKLFKKATGMTPIQYLQGVKIAHAKHALIHTAKSISEVGELVGYDSTSYFIKQFHQMTGETPKQYKTRYS